MTLTPSKPRILVVDDCAQTREMYAEYLSQDFDVTEAADGHLALERAYALLPELIVMDLGLPGMSGAELIQRLKRDGRTQHIPVVIVSGNEEPPRAFDATKSWDAFLRKPCRPAALVALMRRLLAPVDPDVSSASIHRVGV